MKTKSPIRRLLVILAIVAVGWSWYKHMLDSGEHREGPSEELIFLNSKSKIPARSELTNQDTQGQDSIHNSRDTANRQSDQTVDPAMAEAQGLIDKGMITEGTAILEDLVKREPYNTQAMMELAMVYTLDYKTPVKARQLLEKVVDINPNHRAALNELELLYNELGAQSDGLAWLHLKSEQFPEALEVQFAYGRMLANTDPDGAIPWLVKATQIPDDREHAFNELGMAAFKAGKIAMAIDAWSQALQLAEADLEKAKAAGDHGIDLLEDRIKVTRTFISDARKQTSAQ